MPRKIQLFFKRFAKLSSKSTTFFNKLATTANKIQNSVFRAPNFGGILIEFAFSIPVLIILMFFVIDHYRMYELQNKIRTSAYLAASMIQNIGNTSSGAKKIISQNLRHIVYASCLNFFHTRTMFYPYPFGIYYVVDFYYVKRISVNEYQYQHFYASIADNEKDTPNKIRTGYDNPYEINLDSVKEFHPDLECSNNGDERVLVSACYRKKNFNKAKMGFFLVTPGIDRNATNLVRYQLVFTPKPGLFPVAN